MPSMTFWMCSGPRNADELDPARHFPAVHTGSEGLVLQLLGHRLGLEVVDAVGTDQAARVHQPAQLVAGAQDLVEVGLRGDVREVRVPVRQHGVDDLLRVAVLAQARDPAVRVLVRVLLPVQIVQEAGQTPCFLVGSVFAGVEAHGGLHRVHVLPEPLVVDPFVQQGQRVLAAGHRASSLVGWVHTLDEGHRRDSAHSSQRGFRAAHTWRPWKIRRWASSVQRSRGKSFMRSRSMRTGSG